MTKKSKINNWTVYPRLRDADVKVSTGTVKGRGSNPNSGNLSQYPNVTTADDGDAVNGAGNAVDGDDGSMNKEAKGNVDSSYEDDATNGVVGSTCEEKNENVNTSDKERDDTEPQVTSTPSSGSKDSSDGEVEHDDMDAEMLLLRYKNDRERQNKLLHAKKIRQYRTLQEKLIQRRKMREHVQAKGTTSAVTNRGVKDSQNLSKLPGNQVTEDDADPTVAAAPLGGAKPTGQNKVVQDGYTSLTPEVAPKPTAPETRKEAIYGDKNNIELFEDLEDFAVTTEPITSPDTPFALLMDRLLINQLSDLEKVRILFHWVTKQDLNEMTFPSDISDDTPMGFLLGIKQGTKTYARLFSRLCRAAGLHERLISGYLKGVGYIPDHKFTGTEDPLRGSWNAVLIDGQWRLIDTHWGARHVTEEEGDNVNVQQKTVYEYEEHYFLTNPDQMIVSHFPDEIAWQLLPKSVTLDQFQDRVKLWPLYYKMKLWLLSPLNGVVETSSDGVAEFRFGTSDFTRNDGELMCKLTTKSKEKKMGNTLLKQYTFHYSEKNTEVFLVFCPAVGEYILEIYGKSKSFSSNDNFSNVALFQINCRNLTRKEMKPTDPYNIMPKELTAPFPQATHPWGLSPMYNDVQMRSLTHPDGPIITCDETGEATLILEIFSEEILEFLHDMYDADGRQNDEKEPLQNRAVRFTTKSKDGKKLLVIRMRTPQKGIYSIVVFIKAPNEEKYRSCCNYLVVSYAQSAESPPFPPIPNGRLGSDAVKCRELGISLNMVPPYSIDVLNNMGAGVGNAWMDGHTEGYLAFDHAQPLSVDAQLETTDQRDLSSSILVQDTGKHALVVVRPPRKKLDVTEVKLKVYIGPAAEPSIPHVITSLVSCGKDEAKWLPKSPIGHYGINHKQTAVAGVNLCSVSNTTPLFGITASYDQSDPTPCRNFAGGDVIDVKFSFERCIKLRSYLTAIDAAGKNEQLGDETAFILKKAEQECVIRLCIPDPGFYNFILSGSGDADGGSLWRLYSMVIHAKKATTGPTMPNSFSIWNSNICQLISPLNKNLKRNCEQRISLTLAKYSQFRNLETFGKVLLFTEQKHVVEPTRQDTSTYYYEWDYSPGPGEKELHVAVKEDEESTSVSFVLQFAVVD